MADTDPARELADTCTRLAHDSKDRGDVFLAKQFDVPAWSTEFYQIVFAISRRTDDLIEIVNDIELDNDFKEEAIEHIRQIKNAFSPPGLQNPWSSAVSNFLAPAHINPIKMLSSIVRRTYAYPKLEEAEVDEVTALVSDLLDWLRDQQLHEQDFIRQALIDGLEQFVFRLHRVGWLGWGYTLQSLREVIGAYLALERGFPELSAAPDAEAILRRAGAVLKSVSEKIGIMRDVVDKGGFLLKMYGAVVLVTKGHQAIAGLLGGPS